MLFNRLLPGLLFLLILVTAITCTRTIQYVGQEPGAGEYLTMPPPGNVSAYLEKMHDSVKRITSTSYYKTYVFDQDDMITHDILDRAESIDEYAVKVVESHSSSSGSAVVIHNRNNKIGLITAYHTVSSPDQMFEYYDEASLFLESVTIKQRQVNWMFDSPFMGTFDVLASDEVADLAVIGTEVDEDDLDVPASEFFPVFPYKLGDPDKLTLGTFVYTLGYPRGYEVVTPGIVSNSGRDRGHSFITDALFNRGFSGGAVVAINGGLPAFEWVGLARSASATREWHVVPDEDKVEEHSLHLPYTDDLFLERRSNIDYGITHSISATRIRDMLKEHERALSEKGYRIDIE